MVNDAKIPFLTILFFFLGLFLFTKLAGPIPFFVNSIQTTKSNFFYVQGEGEAAAIPDTAQITIGITKDGVTVTDVQQQVNTIMNNITKDLKALGVEEKDIKTTNYSVSPKYDFSNGRQTVNGYTVNQTVRVKVKPIDKANQAVDIAAKNGANIVGGIAFILNDKTKEELEQKARTEAITNAKKKAESLATAAGITLGRIIDVQEIAPYVDNQQPYALGTAEKSVDAAQTDLQPGESTIKMTISLSYETR